ncbi:hypothetical protein MPSEU_000534500 [Mayamaea pseudoterrestris]|nr:hypothetical protein MPSEU_000534500 [Mayamaea pseudoterrestris]
MVPRTKLPRVTSVSSLGTGSFHGAIELDNIPLSPSKQRQQQQNHHEILGCEPNHLEPSVEISRVQQILEALTDKERAQLADPRMPIRHLRAENGNVLLAIQKLKAALQWRHDFQVEQILSDDADMRALIARENATGKIYVRGHDQQGRAMVYMRPARENCNHNLEGNMRHLVWNLEKAIACTRRRSLELGSPAPLEKIILVIDYEGFRLRDSPPLATSKYTLDILQKHYPERMHRAYVVHPPLVFSSFWAIIKNFIDPTTKEKIVFCNHKTIYKLQDVAEDMSKLETCAGGDGSAREFESSEYVNLPFDVSFDA